MKKLLYTCLLLVLLPLCVQAVIPDMKFRRLDIRDGLSNSQVNCVFCDSKGYVWVGTAYGLNRYDGYRVKTFYSNKRDTTSMRDNYTDQIMEGHDGRLWLKQSMNYCIYDPVTEQFERNIGRVLSTYGINGGVERLFIDAQKRYWVKVYEAGLYCYNPHTKKLANVSLGFEKQQLNPTYGICWMENYGDKLLLATFTGELVCVNGEKGVVEWETSWIRENSGLRNQEFKFMVDKQLNIWVYVVGQSFVYIEREHRWYQGIPDLLRAWQVEDVPETMQVWDVKFGSHGWLWIATDHDGLFVVDIKNRQMRQFLNSKFDPTTLSDNTPKNLLVDPRGSVWIGTYKNGVNQYVEGAASLQSVELGDINTATEDRYGNYWLGSNDRGIIVYNPKTSQLVKQYTTANSGLSSNIMVGSHYASDGSIWFGSYNGGLVRCIPSKSDPTEATVVNYLATGGEGALAVNNVWSVTEDRWHRIWIGTLGGGIQMLDLKTNRFRTWNTDNTKLPSNYLTSASWIRKGWLLMGTSWYYCFINPVTGKLANREFPDDPNVPLGSGATVCVMEDSRGLIWQGSMSGAVVYDPKTHRVELLDMTKGLIGSSVCSIVEDPAHTMWVVTDHGVSKVIPDQQDDGNWQFIVRSYSSSDGLQKGTYNQRSAYMTHDGILLVGGQDGLDIIDTKGLSEVRSREVPVFSGLQLFDVDVPVGREVDGRVILKKALNVCRSVTLHSGDQFTIQLASDAGRVGNSKRFVYRLKGFNDNWVKTSAQNPNITYNSLRPGSYTLCVRILNDDGTVGEEESQLDITIRAPLWRTRWAILLYILLLTALAWLWRRWYLRRVERRLRADILRRDVEQHQWMDEMRRQMAEQGPSAQDAASSAEPLQLHCETTDVVELVRGFTRQYQPPTGHTARVNFITTIGEMSADVDREQLLRALGILLDNSVNFSTGDCRISVGVARTDGGDIQIQVADNGIGIRDEYKQHAFDHVPGNEKVGLASVRDIVVAHGGSVRLADNPGGGTIVFITLPVIEEAVLMD